MRVVCEIEGHHIGLGGRCEFFFDFSCFRVQLPIPFADPFDATARVVIEKLVAHGFGGAGQPRGDVDAVDGPVGGKRCAGDGRDGWDRSIVEVLDGVDVGPLRIGVADIIGHIQRNVRHGVGQIVEEWACLVLVNETNGLRHMDMDCGSLLPLSVPQPAAERLDVISWQQAAKLKAAACCRFPGDFQVTSMSFAIIVSGLSWPALMVYLPGAYTRGLKVSVEDLTV